MSKSKLGSHLERHGNRIRVVKMIPPSLWEHFGKKKLKESLPAGTTPGQADSLKWAVLHRLQCQFDEARGGRERENLTGEAVQLREESRRATPHELGDGNGNVVEVVNPVEDYITTRAEAIVARQGEAVARAFADVAFGRATPHLESWFSRRRLGKGYRDDIERALDRLGEWSRANYIPKRSRRLPATSLIPVAPQDRTPRAPVLFDRCPIRDATE